METYSRMREHVNRNKPENWRFIRYDVPSPDREMVVFLNENNEEVRVPLDWHKWTTRDPETGGYYISAALNTIQTKYNCIVTECTCVVGTPYENTIDMTRKFKFRERY